MQNSAVILENVTKTFGKQVAVDELSLNVPTGSVYGFIGPNGSGKTTTLRMLMRIYYPDRGRINVLGNDEHGPANDRVAYLPEERSLYRNMRVRDVLRFFSELKGHSCTNEEIEDWLEKLKLPGVALKKVQTLSKGMTQKVQFIATVICKPKLVLLDEPFSGLDPVNAVVLRELVLDLKKQGTTVIFSTHDMSVAESMCDYIFMIYRGKKVLDGTLDEIRAQYGTDTLRVRGDAPAAILQTLNGVTKVTDHGNYQELRLSPGVDYQQILHEMIARGRVEHFEITHPSLHDIFVRIASPETEVATVGGTE
jgi:ABC-2 type transport system ATP-binding protein